MRAWTFLLLFALSSVLGCGESDPVASPEGEEVASGTGSSGGNPAVVTFQLATEAAPSSTTWNRANIAAAEVVLARRDAAGGCMFGDERFPFGAFIAFGSNTEARLDVSDLCRVRLIPSEGTPLLALDGQIRRRPFDVLLFLPRGLDLVFDRPLPPPREGEALSLVYTLDVGRLLRSIDVSALPADRISITDQDEGEGLTLLENVVDAVVLYLDPTPGDGRVIPEERTDENRIGFVELP